MTEHSWDIGDGYQRWVRGVSQPKFLITLVRQDVIAYVCGCHVKLAKLSNPSEILRVFLPPECLGIHLLEGNPLSCVFALAEICMKPKVFVYKFERTQEALVAQIRGIADTEIRAVRFTKKDLILILSGTPDYQIAIWKWAVEEHVVTVDAYHWSLHSDLQISKSNFHFWVEWGTHHLVLYELQSFTESDVIQTEIGIPVNPSLNFVPDYRLGSKFSFDIISATWSNLGEFYILDEYKTIHHLNASDKFIEQIGQIPYESDNFLYKIVPYDNFLGAIVDDGTFLILQLDGRKIVVKNKINFTSNLIAHIPNLTAPQPNTSFFGVTEIDKKIECVLNGKLRAGFNLMDLHLSEIITFCFIEPKADYIGVVTEKGIVYILDTKNGNIFCRWKLPYFVCSIISHPLFDHVIVGSMDGCAYFLDITNLKQPVLIYRSFFHEDAVIDTLVFMCRGRFLIAGDSSCGLIFLQYSIPIMDFEYLDHANLEGAIRAINTSCNYKDKRFQVLIQRDKNEEVPIVVNNYRIDGDCLDLVASQLLDCSITTMCFSNYKRYMYAYSAESGMGMSQFTEDMNAGSMKEPEIIYECNLPLEINRLKLMSGILYSFGQDGIVRIHDSPPPKGRSIETLKSFQTHFPSYEGIRDGYISMNGCHMITFGNDNTLVHVQIKSTENVVIDWTTLQFGTESSVRKMIEQQLHYFTESNTQVKQGLGDYEKSLSTLLIEETEFYEVHSTEEEVNAILEGLDGIRTKFKSLMELNDSYEEFEKVPLDEFELDEEEEEESQLDFEQNRKMSEAIVIAGVEEREEWANGMKDFLYSNFQVKSYTLKGFSFDTEVTNYPLTLLPENCTQNALDVREERRMEKKLAKAKKEIIRLQNAHNQDIRRLRRASKRKRPKKKLDFSRFPPNVREEMRQLFEDLATPESHTTSSSDHKPVFQDEMGYFERLLKKQSSAAEDKHKESKIEKEKEKEKKKKLEESHIKMGLGTSLTDIDHSDEKLSKNEGEDGDGEGGEGDDEEGKEDEESSSSSEEQLSGGGSTDDDGTTQKKKKTKNRVFFGRPSKQALQAQGISAKNAEKIDARAEKAAVAEELIQAAKTEQAKLSKQKEQAEIEKSREAAFLAKHNIKLEQNKQHLPTEIITIVPPKSPRVSDSDIDGDEDEDEGKGERKSHDHEIRKRKKIRVKKHIIVNDVEKDEWVTESDSSEDSEEEVEKEVFFEKAMEEYKQKFMSHTQIHRNIFIKKFESGGRVYEYIEPSPGYYPQMETVSLQQHIMQIDLIRFDLRRLQSLFNTEFETVRRLKETSIKGIRQRNARIREIAEYLGLELEVHDPGYNIWETPESIFIVTNEEIPIEPYLTVAEREEAERLRLEEEARRLAKSEDFREKALITMMDGVLESRREDVLKKDIPKPRFMLVKEQWEWNFEDYRRADDYYELVEQLEQLREEFRKELEIEIRQLIKLNADAKSLFDKRLAQLFTYKLSIEHACRLEEIKIIRLTRQLTRRDFYQRKEDIQSALLRRMQERMKAAKGLGAQISARIVVCTAQYDSILEREKIMQSEFRGNISEAGSYMETFFRLYKKTPKLLVKQDRMTELLVLMIKGLDTANLRWFAHEHGELGQLVADAIFELDEPIQIPVGCPRSTWDKFCRLRRNRIIAEFEARVTGTELVQLRAVVVECKKREDEIAQEMAQVLARMSTQKNYKLFHIQNGEMQMVIPQGRIEATITRSSDFNDIIICKTSVILKLNTFIKAFTVKLVTQLSKSKIQHRGILQLDWHFRKINLREKHLLAKLKDISTLRVTKEVLEFLRLHHDFRSMQDRRLIRIRKLQELAELFHGRYMEGMSKLQRIIQGGVNRFEKDSNRKSNRLDKKNIRYNTLKVKCNIDNPEMAEEKRIERLQLIMRISHMARLYSQCEETIVTLETELERLYDKTYPYL